ncbi:MAG: putative toxin-antitoxin system toxin component, PIN family [Gammaproteobacteria bacterium]
MHCPGTPWILWVTDAIRLSPSSPLRCCPCHPTGYPLNTVVLDTNVLLDLWLVRDPAVEPLRAALHSGLLRPVRSPATDAEFAEVLARPQLFSIAPERAAALLEAWRASASPVEGIQSAPWVCRDSLDQKFLGLAVTAGANWLITKDRDLLKLACKARRQGLAIVTPGRWSALAAAPPSASTAAPPAG